MLLKKNSSGSTLHKDSEDRRFHKDSEGCRFKSIPMLLQDTKNGAYVGWDLSHHFSIDEINIDLLDKHYQVVWV
jgi:hypothetical protein